MTNGEILADAAKDCGLTDEQRRLLLLYGKAAKAATLAVLNAAPEEAKRLSDLARERKLEFELCLRLEVAAELPDILTNEREYHLGNLVASADQELRKLRKDKHGKEALPPKDPIVTQTQTKRRKWVESGAGEKPQTPKTPRQVGRERILAA